MGKNDQITDKLKGKIVEEVAFTDYAAVLKFTDGTFLDIYLDPSKEKLKISTNKLS